MLVPIKNLKHRCEHSRNRTAIYEKH